MLISQGKYEDFFKNEESENKENQSKDFEIYTQMYADFLDQIMIQKDQLANPSNWENYVNDVLKKSSRVENYIKKHKELYCNELFKMCR
ncbi:MAG: hypothetical protein PHX44_04145 [Sulfurimonas sp.]|uniref:hypothetical protein n=1 Tax=Sulfurimonas sp. TaxID=2022749 RepID=UPI002627FDCE|nr:hypothetical protein [Sulfurimonas sp.]MDD2652223.1 hypothetical protein [Sulfurimonas sp.]MDD3450495.1 hypothetical protein [Sulfurimonas sp.]